MKRSPKALQIVVRSLSSHASKGCLHIGDLCFPCALGKSGKTYMKREGDAASPKGTWQPLQLFYRADRMRRPKTGLKSRPIRPMDGWCDAVLDRNYNRLISHPYPASAERLWRQDHLYDLLVILNHNSNPRRQGHGSAIFIHAAALDYSPTEGCIALSPEHLKILVAHMNPRTRITI